MYTIEIRTSQPWQVRKQFLEASRWTVVAKVATKIDAQKDVAWFTHEMQESTSYLKKFKAEYRIRDGSDVVWQKEEVYNS